MPFKFPKRYLDQGASDEDLGDVVNVNGGARVEE
jgi:hypothetical protein